MKIILVVISLIFADNSISQTLTLNIAYDYCYSKQLDNAIQSYNFARPFLANKQPLLMHGTSVSASYIFKSEKHFKHGINISYSYFRSHAENENTVNNYNLHFLNLGYLVHYDNPEKWKGFYLDLIFSATSSGLFRKINQEPFVYDDNKSKALGIGGDIGLRMGYEIYVSKSISISPFVLIGYSPYVYSPKNEVVINQTKGLTGKNWTGILNAQIGCAIHLKKRNTERNSV